MWIVIAPIAVALVAFILYALERKMKSEPIHWESATKLSILGGLITSGVIFATDSSLPAVANVVAETIQELPASQEMFVGVPSF